MSNGEARIVNLIVELGGSQQCARDLWRYAGGSVKGGSLYTTLNRCCAKGFLDDYEDMHSSGNIRRMYKVTTYGRRVLAERRKYMNSLGTQ